MVRMVFDAITRINIKSIIIGDYVKKKNLHIVWVVIDLPEYPLWHFCRPFSLWFLQSLRNVYLWKSLLPIRSLIPPLCIIYFWYEKRFLMDRPDLFKRNFWLPFWTTIKAQFLQASHMSLDSLIYDSLLNPLCVWVLMEAFSGREAILDNSFVTGYFDRFKYTWNALLFCLSL